MSKTKKILILLVLILGVAQFIPHEHPKPTIVDASAKFTTDNTELKNILDKACMDCHSNETRYPWYAEIAPVNFWLDAHIEHAREEFNFSEWNTYPPEDQAHIAKEIREAVGEKEMPMLSYWLVHWEAKLTDAERKTILDHFSGRTGDSYPGHQGEYEHEDDD